MQIICTSLQTDSYTSTLSLIFFRLDALPDAQPTVSKHQRQVVSIKTALIDGVTFFQMLGLYVCVCSQHGAE